MSRNPDSYYVSRHADGRDEREILSASSYEHAASIAHIFYGMVPSDDGTYTVTRNGDTRTVDSVIQVTVTDCLLT